MKVSELLFGKSAEDRIIENKKLYPKRKAVRPQTTTIKTQESYNLSYPETQVTSIFESEKKNKRLRVVDKTTKLIGEKPPVDFAQLIDYKNRTPQLDTIIGIETDMIVGNDLIVNADNDEIKKICDKLNNDLNLYEKIRNHTTVSLTTGYGLLYRVGNEKEGLTNIEEFDIETIIEAFRDEYGNIKSFTQDLGSFEKENIPFTPEFLPIVFKKNGRSAFGLSEFHALAVSRKVGNRTTRPAVEGLWSLDDVTIGTLENFAYPVEYHVYEGANDDDLKVEAKKLKDQKPGDRFVISRPHQIDRREPTQARFEPYINHFKDLLQHGTGFPIDLLSGDFTSRASSETADSFFMRKIKSRQKYLTKTIKEGIFEYHLSLLGHSEEEIAKANVTVEFEIDIQPQYTPEIVGNRVASGMWTKAEGREYDKGNGQDLFDDDTIKANDTQKAIDAQKEIKSDTIEESFSFELKDGKFVKVK